MVTCQIIYERNGLVIGYYAFNNYPLTNSIINIQGIGKYVIMRVEHVFKTSSPIDINNECSTIIYVKNSEQWVANTQFGVKTLDKNCTKNEF